MLKDENLRKLAETGGNRRQQAGTGSNWREQGETGEEGYHDICIDHLVECIGILYLIGPWNSTD